MKRKTAQTLATFLLTLAILTAGPLLAAGPGTAAGDGWVRTSDGWERAQALRPRKRIYEPALHPAVLASLVTLASLMALVAFPAADGKPGA